MHIATIETRNFTFEGAGATQEEAMDALRRGLDEHTAQHKLEPTWFGSYLPHVEMRQIEPGACYRDREVISEPVFSLTRAEFAVFEMFLQFHLDLDDPKEAAYPVDVAERLKRRADLTRRIIGEG